MSQTEPPAFHADFARDAGDVTLVSSDVVHFCVASRDLIRTSAFFRGMFDLPQPEKAPIVADDAIALPEDADTIEILLKLALGLPAPLERLATFEAIEAVLRAAEKYDMLGPVQVLGHALRGLLASKTFACDPLRQYGLAMHFGWADIAQNAYDRLLVADLDFDKIPAAIDGPTLGRLVAARQTRARTFIAAFRNNPST